MCTTANCVFSGVLVSSGESKARDSIPAICPKPLRRARRAAGYLVQHQKTSVFSDQRVQSKGSLAAVGLVVHDDEDLHTRSFAVGPACSSGKSAQRRPYNPRADLPRRSGAKGVGVKGVAPPAQATRPRREGHYFTGQCEARVSEPDADVLALSLEAHRPLLHTRGRRQAP